MRLPKPVMSAQPFGTQEYLPSTHDRPLNTIARLLKMPDATDGYWAPRTYLWCPTFRLDTRAYRRSRQASCVFHPSKAQHYREPIEDIPLNLIGRLFRMNWFGRNVTGGDRFVYQQDERGQFRLGGSAHRTDQLLRRRCREKHDIQYYVDKHYAKGQEVEVPTPDGGKEYYQSRGETGATNALVVRDMLLSTSPIFHLFGGRPSEDAHQETNDFVPLNRETLQQATDREKRYVPLERDEFQQATGRERRDDRFGPPGGGGGGVGPQLPIATSPLQPSNVGGVYLGGAGKMFHDIGRLQGVAVDSNNRLVLIGATDEQVTLPPIRLDDIVTVFRSIYLHGQAPMCRSIQILRNPDGPHMLIRHDDSTAGTHVGWTLFECDRVMKAYSLGYDNVTGQTIRSTVDGYQNLFDLGFSNLEQDQLTQAWERFWIVPASITRRMSHDGQLSLLDVRLKLMTQAMTMHDGTLVPAPGTMSSDEAHTFAEWFTKQYDAIATEAVSSPPQSAQEKNPEPVFQELRRIALVTAVAERLRDQGIPLPSWMRDYSVSAYDVPRKTAAIIVETTGVGKSRAVQTGALPAEGVRVRRVYGGVNLSCPDHPINVARTNRRRRCGLA